MIEQITHFNKLLAIVIRHNYHADGIQFFTPNGFSQQLAYMSRPSGYEIQPHVHNPVSREIFWTQEVLFIKSGKVEVSFFTDEKKFLETRILVAGDVILLAAGGHGFKMLEPTEIIEVKQGPYCGDQDKTRFNPKDPQNA